MLRIILLDDEGSALTLLRHKLIKNFPEELEIIATFDDPMEAVAAMGDISFDLLFLDIEMPGMSGLEVLEAFPGRKFEVIFTTAYPQFAIAALRNAAFDYLVKPIDEGDLKNAVERVLGKKYARKEHQLAVNDLSHLAQSLLKVQSTVPKLNVATADGLIRVPIADIIRLEGSGSYAVIHLIGKQSIIASKNLSEFEIMLADHTQFFRTHKSHLINLNHVSKYLRGEGGSVIMSDGSEVEVARRRKEDFLGRL